uniref:SRCR domain-containing protein n=1 Tax=Bos indicus x Bos taurus TaxID=30522 RepID=A0A4W2DYJ6_BOBOX
MALGRHLSLRGLYVLLLGTLVGGQALELRLKDGAHRCEGRVEVKHQGEWGTVYAHGWRLKDASVVCRQLGCGAAIGFPGGAYFGPGLGPIWLFYTSCEGTESTVSDCEHSNIKDYRNDSYSHDDDAGVVCSGFVRLAGGDGPCSGRVEVHSGEAWIPVSDGNFTLATAQIICAELGCGKAVSVLGHELFRESSAQVWAEEFRCEGEEPELWVCPRVPCPGGTCHHSGSAQVVCSAYSEVRLMTNGSSQCEGQVEMNISGQWRALCASHWSLANANVICRQLGCGVAISTPGGPHLVEEGDQILTARFHCSGAESFLWSCPVTVLGGPDCSHGNTASVICSGNQIQVLPQCNDSVSQPTGSAASEDSAPYCSDSRQIRLVDGGGRCSGRVEILDQGSWGTICDDRWDLDDARVVCKQLGCGEALDATVSSFFGTGSGPIWLDEVNCRGEESQVWRCPSWGWRQHNCNHQEDAGVICSGMTLTPWKESNLPRQQPSNQPRQHIKKQRYYFANKSPSSQGYELDCEETRFMNTHRVCCSLFLLGFVRLAGGDGPCSGRVEVHSGEAWTPVSDGNFTPPTAQVICAELGCGKAVSVLGHMPFRESDGQVWAEEFRCDGGEPELWSCPRVPCPGGTCLHSGAAQVVCSVYTEVQLMKNGTSQCEGQVEMKISGRWRALCASHWSLANANVVCRQLGCGVAISTPRGPHLVEGGDQISTAQFHCSGAESYLWSCPVTALGGPDCSHGNTASVICSGNHTQVLPQCNDFLSQPAGSAASEESSPYCSDSRQLRLVDGGGPCAGRVEILDQGSWGTICDDGWDLDDARVVCRQLGCGEALNATGSAHFGAGSGPIWLDDLNCTGKESHVWRCPSRGWGRHDCRHKEDAGVICSEFLALRMVSEDQQCAGWLEVFYNGTWGSVCRSPMEDITVSVICRQLGCGDSGSLNTSVGLREGSRPRWVDLIQCRKMDTSLWQCPSGPWKYSSCSPKEEAYISCEGRRPKSCPTAAACTDREKLRLRGGDSECSGRVEVWHNGSWGTVCDDSWSLAEAEVVCQQLGCGQALEAVRSAAFGPGNGSIWLDEVQCGGRESSLWDCVAEPWGQSNCKHEEDAGVRCSGVRTTLPTTTAGTRTTSNSLPGIFSLPGVLCLILGSLLFLVLVILVTQLLRWRAERRALSSYEDALAEAVYEELDYLLTQKEGLGSPDQTTEVPDENYDDAEEVPVPGTPSPSQGNEEEVPPEKEDGVRSSQTGSFLNFSREAANPGEGEESFWLLQGKKGDAGYDDVELSALGTSPVTFS